MLIRKGPLAFPRGVGRGWVASPTANFYAKPSPSRPASASVQTAAMNGFAAGDEAPPTLRRSALMASTPAPHGVRRQMSALKRGRSYGHSQFA